MAFIMVAAPNNYARKEGKEQIQKQTPRTKMRTVCTVARIMRRPYVAIFNMGGVILDI